MKKHKFGMTSQKVNQLESGDLTHLVETLADFAKYWVEMSGFPFQQWATACFTNIAAENANSLKGSTSEQRAFLAAGCDLLHLLSLTPQGREAISHLIGEPLSQKTEGK